MENYLICKELRKNIAFVSLKIKAIESQDICFWSDIVSLKSLRALRNSFRYQLLKYSDEYKKALKQA